MSPPHYSLPNTEITCAKPGAGTNTKAVSGGRRKLDQYYTYSCKGGYTATSNKLKTVCVEDGDASSGKWSVPPPTCKEITCAKPGAGTNTKAVSGGRRKLDQYYTYSCKGGYTATSNKLKTVCVEDGDASSGKWSVPPPTCKEITCAKPGAGTNTKAVSGGRRKLDQYYTYSCKGGYTATSNKLKTVCVVDGDASSGKWSVPPPTCKDLFLAWKDLQL
ncbi:complement decay-accelerating factor-like [Strongylocentrotus purpuratus]|uniref:Sushi domain-containing protein n=1 Tax=Strongylocentrotus purpuratus TaxID=7668 RepID=A0A7M7PDL4_STRPU|nr:complement decay-accelerating factor-like [Strongylocentrotus purpuratus]